MVRMEVSHGSSSLIQSQVAKCGLSGSNRHSILSLIRDDTFIARARLAQYWAAYRANEKSSMLPRSTRSSKRRSMPRYSMLAQEMCAQPRVECDGARRLGWAPQVGSP